MHNKREYHFTPLSVKVISVAKDILSFFPYQILLTPEFNLDLNQQGQTELIGKEMFINNAIDNYAL